MKSSFEIKALTTVEQLLEVQSLERAVWNMDPIPIHQTVTAIKHGGLMIGAYDEDRLIGFSYGFAGYTKGQIHLCSHMLGIHPAYQKQGLGKLLKEEQKKIAKELGYSLITWTFDPLESLNAHLNLNKLKAIAAASYENVYGQMQDSLNNSLPTDRFFVEWWIDSPHVHSSTRRLEPNSMEEGRSLLELDENTEGFPTIMRIKTPSKEEMKQQTAWLVPIPTQFQQIKKLNMNLAMDWRMKTREVFAALFQQGFVAVEVIREMNKNVHYYVFVPKQRVNLSSHG